MDNYHIKSSRKLVLVDFFLLLIISPARTDYADITTIYMFQHDSNNILSKESTEPNCQVYIHTGSSSKHLPFVINNEIVFPNLYATRSQNTIQIKEMIKQSDVDILNKETNTLNNEILTNSFDQLNENNKTTISNITNIEENLNKLLIFDSNNLSDTQWIFDSRIYNNRRVQTIDTSNLGDLFSKTITKLRVNIILNEIDQRNLNDIITKNNSRTVSTKTKQEKSNVPSIIKLSKSFESKCESCRFDFYKTKNGTKWDLIIIRNYEEQDDKNFKESAEEDLELENNPMREVQNDEPHKLDMSNDESIPNGIGNKLKTRKMDKVKNKRSQNQDRSRKFGSNSRDAEPMLSDDQNNGSKTSREEMMISSKSKLLLSYDEKDDNTEDLILKTLLEQNSTYFLKIQFKTQSYFKVTFLLDNTTDYDSGVFENVEVTVRGTCEDVSGTVGTRNTQYYVDVNTGNDFKTLTINTVNSQIQTLEIMFRSEILINIKNGFANHQIDLLGAQIFDIEFYNICFDNGFNRFQFDLYESVSSLFSKIPATKFTSSKPSLTSPWFRNRKAICWTILFTNLTRRWSDYNYECYDERNIDDKVGIQINVEHGDGEEKQLHKYCVETNGAIVRMLIMYENNSTDSEFIRFLVEIDSTIGIRFIYNSDCNNDVHLVQEGICDAIDKVAYDVAYKHNFYKGGSNVKYCLNQGSLVEGRCVCPSGFMGKHCEEACGENKFGHDCSGECTANTNTTGWSGQLSGQCQGMLLCTHYGCTCAPGYHGKYCTEQCTSGFYGNDCKDRCGQCLSNTTCNIYTGHCTECASNHLIPPYCQESYPYLNKPPRVLSRSYFSVQLEVNAQSENVKGDTSEMGADYFYVILTKDLTWHTEEQSKEFALNLANPNSTDNLQTVWIQNLVPGHTYAFQVLLFDDIGNTHDPVKAPVTNVMTKCLTPTYKHKVTVEVTSTTARLYWVVTKVTYEAWNITKTDINKIYDLNTTINQINRLFNSTTGVEVIEDLNNLTREELNVVFKCRKETQYSLKVKKVTKKSRSQDFKSDNVHSGFTLKYLDPGNKYLVRLYLHNNNDSGEIWSSIVETEAQLSEMDDLEVVRKVDKSVVIRWNTNQGRRIAPVKKIKATNTSIQNETSGTNINQTTFVSQYHTDRSNSSNSRVGKTMYYIKYKIVKQRACNQYFNHNTQVIATTKTEYKLELDYFTTYSIFITENKGQSLANQYLFVSTNASVPDISPHLLHVTRVTASSASLAWADLSLSNYECALLNGMLMTYELVVTSADNSNSTETHLCEELELELQGLSSGVEYGVELRYVNHVGKSRDRFASLSFRTL